MTSNLSREKTKKFSIKKIKVNRYVKTFIYGFVPTAIGTAFLTYQLSNRVNASWVAFAGIYAGGLGISIKALENEPTETEAILRLNRTVLDTANREASITVTMLMLQDSIEALNTRIGSVASEMSYITSENKATRRDGLATRASVNELHTILVPLVERMNSPEVYGNEPETYQPGLTPTYPSSTPTIPKTEAPFEEDSEDLYLRTDRNTVPSIEPNPSFKVNKDIWD